MPTGQARLPLHGLCTFAVLLLITPAMARAQTFTPIADGYECVRFPDGRQEIANRTESGFVVLKSGPVRNRYSSRSKDLRRKIRLLDKKLAQHAEGKLKLAKLLKVTNKILTQALDESGLPKTTPLAEIEAEFLSLRSRLEQRLQQVTAVIQLIDDCLDGKTPGGGTPVSPTMIAFAAKAKQPAGVYYGAWMAVTNKLPYEGNPQGGGYPACIKVVSRDGEVNRYYAGLSDDRVCGTGTLKLEGVPQAECDAVVPAGKVAYVRESIVINFPVEPEEEVLERARVYAQANMPTVTILAFLGSLTRDEEIALCNAF